MPRSHPYRFRRCTALRAGLVFGALLASAACGGPDERPIAITFEARVGEAPFECGRSYPGVGTTRTEFIPLDFRFYVHDVRVVTASGEVAVRLADDGRFQGQGVALVDFETGPPACESGDRATHVELVGSVPASTGPILGLRFRMGVPEALNHLDASLASPPLDGTAMFWGWQAGYKFLRIDARSTGQPGGFLFHLGATNCSGDATMGTRRCANGNRPAIALDGFDPETSIVIADLASLFATSNLDADAGGERGCMSSPSDPECAVLFEAVGLGDPPMQRLFRVERR